ncbi:hypothetical protein [Pseudoramibacter faecis]|uniref:hypothetical protein n=1 Tax=Pseudoramibacter faecis TaxID=3108534 RepID=UPI002E75CA00|nr:hypothetical protein [Pseudoramibacter sp. HA2172]
MVIKGINVGHVKVADGGIQRFPAVTPETVIDDLGWQCRRTARTLSSGAGDGRGLFAAVARRKPIIGRPWRKGVVRFSREMYRLWILKKRFLIWRQLLKPFIFGRTWGLFCSSAPDFKTRRLLMKPMGQMPKA